MPASSKRVVFAGTLRHNVSIESDVALAEREFKVLLGVVAVRVLSSWDDCTATPFADLPAPASRAIQARLRAATPIGFVCETSTETVDTFLSNAAFFQDVAIRGPVDWRPKSPLARAHEAGLFSAVPAAAVAEYACQIHSAPSRDARLRLDAMLLFLLTGDKGAYQAEIATALNSKKSTLALTHDLHIYKAKFFPRMVRALSNVFAADMAGGAILDPFSGSGTALLEASARGIRSFGCDLDPLSTLISQSKVEPFTRGRKATRLLLETVHGEIDLDMPLFRKRGKGRAESSVLSEELRGKLLRQDARNGTAYLPEIDGDLAALQALRTALSHERPGLLEVLLSDAVTKKIRYRFVGVGNGRYTIEVVRQPILERLREKVASARALCDIFEWLEDSAGVRFAPSDAALGDATTLSGVPRGLEVTGCLTSPPYLPASSGREHYASSRALALAVTGLTDAMNADKFVGASDHADLKKFDPSLLTQSGRNLLTYLLSDGDRTDPQRDAMRFERKAVPTWRYLLEIEKFLGALRTRMGGDRGVCLMVVASQHTFYSHRQLQEAKKSGSDDQAIEYVANGKELYGELAARAGWEVDEEVRMELAKAATSMARPRAQDQYAESILVLRPAQSVASPKSRSSDAGAKARPTNAKQRLPTARGQHTKGR
jgi:hypothetical protein